ncbi:MAG: YtxH domain-containing protein [Agromyces sp.]
MRGKILFGVGLGLGYVLGTRAGRKRYEQLKAVAGSLWNTEPVQHSVDAAKGFALSYTGDAAEAVLDGVKKLIRIATRGAERAERAADETVSEVLDAAAQAVPAKTKRPAAAKPKSGTSESK